jgi:hypothetical protein
MRRSTGQENSRFFIELQHSLLCSEKFTTEVPGQILYVFLISATVLHGRYISSALINNFNIVT